MRGARTPTKCQHKPPFRLSSPPRQVSSCGIVMNAPWIHAYVDQEHMLNNGKTRTRHPHPLFISAFCQDIEGVQIRAVYNKYVAEKSGLDFFIGNNA